MKEMAMEMIAKCDKNQYEVPLAVDSMQRGIGLTAHIHSKISPNLTIQNKNTHKS